MKSLLHSHGNNQLSEEQAHRMEEKSLLAVLLIEDKDPDYIKSEYNQKSKGPIQNLGLES